jgi:TonB family protein
MHFAFRWFTTGLTIVVFAVPLSLWGSLPAQQGSDSVGEASANRAILDSPSEFEVKVVQGSLLVRKKGTSKWIEPSKLNEPVAVGHADGQKVYVATKVIRPPKARHTQSPDYPESERKSGREGWVSLHIVVDEQGTVRFPTADESPGPQFTESAIEAVKKSTFEPAKLNGQPVAALVSVSMEFRLYPQHY